MRFENRGTDNLFDHDDLMNIARSKGATRRGAKGAEALPLAKSELKKR